MAIIKTHQGDADTLTETITGLDSLSGYSAKLYIYTKGDVEIDTISGTIAGLTIVYQLVNEDTKLYTLGKHKFETKLWDSSDHVYTPTSGTFLITKPIENDPS